MMRRSSEVWVLAALTGFLLTLAIEAAAASTTEDSDSPKRLYYLFNDPGWASPEGTAPPDSLPVWTRDGSEILFQATRDEGFAQIYAIRPDGTGLRRVTDGRYRAGHPSTSPLADRFVFITDKDGEREIYSLGLDGRDRRQLTADGIPKFYPAYAPDGAALLFVRAPQPDTDVRELCVLDLETGEVAVRYRAPIGLSWSAWSHDGADLLFFQLLTDRGINHLFRVGRTAGDARALSWDMGADYWNPHPSPDGTHLSFLYNRRVDGDWGSNPEIAVLDLATARLTTIASHPRYENAQRFSPDGRHLAFLSDRTGYYELYVIRADGSGLKQLTSQPALELTQVVRTESVEAAVAHDRRHRSEGTLFWERAMRYLLEDMTAAGDGPRLPLAEIFAATYPDSIHAHRFLAGERFAAGDLTGALESYESTLARDPHSAEAMMRLGILRTLALHDGTDGTADEATVNRLGYALLEAGRAEDAVALMRYNVLHHPNSWNAHDSLGEALLGRGEVEAARAAYRRSLELNADNHNAVRVLRSLTPARP